MAKQLKLCRPEIYQSKYGERNKGGAEIATMGINQTHVQNKKQKALSKPIIGEIFSVIYKSSIEIL